MIVILQSTTYGVDQHLFGHTLQELITFGLQENLTQLVKSSKLFSRRQFACRIDRRTFVVGPATPAQRALFGVARATEDAVFEALRPGVAVADLYPTAEAVVARGAPPHFPAGSLVLPGFVGHGIGLELDEPPVLWPRDDARLQAGMVLAIEVEVSAPGQGTMVKLEDTVVVQPDGCELLTATPRELIECD